MFSNVRRLMNIISTPCKAAKPEVGLSLDAEKAFDRVEWKYLFKMLEKIWVWSKIHFLIYTSPQARVHTNNQYSSYFSLPCGTHCHLYWTLGNFDKFSRYKINHQKMNWLAKQPILFHLSSDSFRYLGINIAHSFQELYKHNFDKLLTCLIFFSIIGQQVYIKYSAGNTRRS